MSVSPNTNKQSQTGGITGALGSPVCLYVLVAVLRSRLGELVCPGVLSGDPGSVRDLLGRRHVQVRLQQLWVPAQACPQPSPERGWQDGMGLPVAYGTSCVHTWRRVL